MLKYSSKKSIVVIACFFVLSLCLFMTGTCRPVFADSYGYTSNRFDVSADVKSDNSIIVKETIKVDFDKNKHGIYRYIPLTGKVNVYADGETKVQKRDMVVDKVNVKDYNFETSKENGNLVIKIGDADEYVTGKQTYEISYRCRLYDDKNSENDSFYYNVLPDGWETPIKKSKITITMPQTVNMDQFLITSGAKGEDVQGYITSSASGKTIIIKNMMTLPKGMGVSVYSVFPEGYFHDELSVDWTLPLIIILAILALVGEVILWFFFGRDPDVIETVEFYPPEGMTSAEVGYVIDGYADKEDIVSMIIYFAEKGYLAIEEKGKKDFILTKQKDLPKNSKTYQKTLFRGLFEGHETIALSDLGESFYDNYSAARSQLESYYKKDENRIFSKQGDKARILGSLIMVLPVGFGIFLGGGYEKDWGMWIVAVPVCLIMMALFVGAMRTYDKKDSLSIGQKSMRNVLFYVGSMLMLLVGVTLTAVQASIPAGIAVAVSSVACYFFTRQMRKRTDMGAEVMGKILGFRAFIRMAELDKLKALVDEDPKYFYNILPYAYVFGLSDKWAKKFESISVEPPSWYRGDYTRDMFSTWMFINAFNNCTSAIDSNIVVPSAEGDSSVTFGGGGGFSGGGFGGGGGGSW